METEDAIAGLSALAHPGRLAVFRLLVQAGPDGAAAGDIARALDTPANTMSTQLAILSRAGLIGSRRESRSIIYSADFERISGLIGFLMQDCCQGRAEVCAPLVQQLSCASPCAPATELAQ